MTYENITYQDGYFIVKDGPTGKFSISVLNDGTSWDRVIKIVDIEPSTNCRQFN